MGRLALTFAVERWCAWQPVAGGAFQCSGHANGDPFQFECEKPDVSTVPPMQRRRLGNLARAAFHVLDRCANPALQEPLVFSSKMGEIHRTQKILESIAGDEPVSPASFSLSVHNAVGGLWSLVHGIKAPVLALAPVDCSPVPAILEACGILNEGRYAAVNIVYCEEDYPEFYAPWFDSPHAPLALALRLVNSREAPRGDAQLYDMYQSPFAGESTFQEAYTDLVRLLTGHLPTLEVLEGQCGWALSRQA